MNSIVFDFPMESLIALVPCGAALLAFGTILGCVYNKYGVGPADGRGFIVQEQVSPYQTLSISCLAVMAQTRRSAAQLVSVDRLIRPWP
jgi:hypothetical protein